MKPGPFGDMLNLGTGGAEARAAMNALTRQDLISKGVTVDMAAQWALFYKNTAQLTPSNPSAATRFEYFKHAVLLLSGG
jgi:hypothetical protein